MDLQHMRPTGWCLPVCHFQSRWGRGGRWRGTGSALQGRCGADSGMHPCVRAAVSSSVCCAARADRAAAEDTHIPGRLFQLKGEEYDKNTSLSHFNFLSINTHIGTHTRMHELCNCSWALTLLPFQRNAGGLTGSPYRWPNCLPPARAAHRHKGTTLHTFIQLIFLAVIAFNWSHSGPLP